MKRKQTTYQRYFVVEGLGEFPLDMLRYDCAFPASEPDAHRAQHDRKRRLVAICSRRVNDGEPTEARWRSQGWRVVQLFDDMYNAVEFAKGEGHENNNAR